MQKKTLKSPVEILNRFAACNCLGLKLFPKDFCIKAAKSQDTLSIDLSTKPSLYVHHYRLVIQINLLILIWYRVSVMVERERADDSFFFPFSVRSIQVMFNEMRNMNSNFSMLFCMTSVIIMMFIIINFYSFYCSAVCMHGSGKDGLVFSLGLANGRTQ